MIKEIIEQTMPNGESVEIVNIVEGDNAISMLKSTWDELEKAKELG